SALASEEVKGSCPVLGVRAVVSMVQPKELYGRPAANLRGDQKPLARSDSRCCKTLGRLVLVLLEDIAGHLVVCPYGGRSSSGSEHLRLRNLGGLGEHDGV